MNEIHTNDCGLINLSQVPIFLFYSLTHFVNIIDLLAVEEGHEEATANAALSIPLFIFLKCSQNNTLISYIRLINYIKTLD